MNILFLGDIVGKAGCEAVKKYLPSKIKEFKIEILPAAIGLFFVLSTFLSKSLSTMSLKMHPALLIKTEPKKNNIT